MALKKKFTDVLRVRVDHELHELVRKEAEKLNTDVSTYVRWCMRTGLYLDDLNTFIRAKTGEDDVKKPDEIE